MVNRNYITVAELNYYINHLFVSEELLHNIYIVGEVSGCNIVKGNCYFTLKDDKAQIKIVYFNIIERHIPKNGQQVMVRGSVDFYQPNGQLSVKAYEINPFGVGFLYAQLQELKDKLSNEGIFDESHKKEIPFYPINIAIITSVKGAALQDILSTFLRKNSKQNISVIDVRVQGDSCVNDIVTALNNADNHNFDVILLTRGGGSFEDLYAFNDERIIRTIYNMKTPLISAIGHETDYTLCDYVSDYRAITPTAGAEKIAIDSNVQIQNIILMIKSAERIINKYLNDDSIKLNHLLEKLSLLANNVIDGQYAKICKNLSACKNKIDKLLIIKSNKLNELMKVIETINPVKLLNKGYFRIAYNSEIINNFTDINVDSEIDIYGEKEKIHAKIIKKETL